LADFDTTRTAYSGSDARNILARARDDWDRAHEMDRENIRRAYEDLEFLANEDNAQWDAEQKRKREAEGRPTLTVNRLPQFVHKVTGDIRQMKPSLKFVPVDNGADEKVADLYSGLSRYIENRSDAPAIYFRAADSQVAAGIGHWRVTTEYADDTTLNQEIRIAPVDDGISVLWDPDSKLPSREDARYCFVPVDMSRALFQKKYPDITPSDFDDATWTHNSSWVDADFVRVAEYWVREPIQRTIVLLPDGSVDDITDAEDKAALSDIAVRSGARVEKRPGHKVVRYLITASNVLSKDDWIGRHIPIVPVLGEEIRIGRKVIRKGIVRDAIDPQRMVNYFHSAHTETVALQPKAPFIGTETNFAKYQEMWEQANSQNLPYLVYEPDSKNGGTGPQRVQPPVSSQGILQGLEMAQEDLKAVTGIYDASLGARSNETSGRAIVARQRQSDLGSYLFIDNFARAVRRTGQIIADLIPHVYDTERKIRIMGEDGKLDIIEINRANGEGYLNDVTIGSYDVVATVGPNYATRREEAREGMTSFIQAAPAVGPIVMDLVAKSQDWPMADDIAKRIRATMPPQILMMEEMEKQGMEPEQIQQALQQAQQQPPDPAAIKAEMDAQQAQAKLQFDQEKAVMDAQQAERELSVKIMLEREKMQMDQQTRLAVALIQAGVKEEEMALRAATAWQTQQARESAPQQTS